MTTNPAEARVTLPAEMLDRLNQRIAATDAELARVTAERDKLFTTLADVLGNFHEKGHPGWLCIRTGWVREETYAQWHGVLAEIVNAEPPVEPYRDAVVSGDAMERLGRALELVQHPDDGAAADHTTQEA